MRFNWPCESVSDLIQASWQAALRHAEDFLDLLHLGCSSFIGLQLGDITALGETTQDGSGVFRKFKVSARPARPGELTMDQAGFIPAQAA